MACGFFARGLDAVFSTDEKGHRLYCIILRWFRLKLVGVVNILHLVRFKCSID